MPRSLCKLLIVVLVPALVGASGAQAKRWSIRGAGWGHGIGMSQYGAYGYAKHGAGYRAILRHYYSDTQVQERSGHRVHVLLQPNRSRVSFRGATSAAGRMLSRSRTYRATRSGSRVVLRSSRGRRLRTVSGRLKVDGPGAIRLLGSADNGVSNGTYRGALEIRTAGGSGLNAINVVDLESYVRGVVAAESPASWPAAALRAQAVAARSYALATNVNGKGFDQYADTRSQVYEGVRGETRATDSAVSHTHAEVVTYRGKVAVTYFFSTSGGKTENVENVFLGSESKPWLKGVDDPYDDTSPYHRWGPIRYTTASLTRKLGGYVRGRFRGLKVTKRGTSPRIVRARVKGTRGSVNVSGPQLKSRLDLRDTWFTVARPR